MIKCQLFTNGNGTSTSIWVYKTPFKHFAYALCSVCGTDSSGSGCDSSYVVTSLTELKCTHDYVTTNRNNYIYGFAIGF